MRRYLQLLSLTLAFKHHCRLFGLLKGCTSWVKYQTYVSFSADSKGIEDGKENFQTTPPTMKHMQVMMDFNKCLDRTHMAARPSLCDVEPYTLTYLGYIRN